MSCSALCMARLKNGSESPPVDPTNIDHLFYINENDAIQFFFAIRGERKLNAFNTLLASDVFLRARSKQIEMDKSTNSLPCPAVVLEQDIREHHQFLIDSAMTLLDRGQVSARHMGEFETMTGVAPANIQTIKMDLGEPQPAPPAS